MKGPIVTPSVRSLACALLAASIAGCSSSNKTEPTRPPARAASKTVADSDPQQPPRAKQQVETGVCRVFTADPGFFVFVDGEPARDGTGDWVTTPCAVTVARGEHEILVARKGRRDAGRRVLVGREAVVRFEREAESAPAGESILDAAHLRAKTAVPIPLLALNSSARDLDPYITPDGKSLYFVSDRDGRRGIYSTSRKTPHHYFSEKPKLVEATLGYDLPASPGLTADGKALVYSIPAAGIVYGLSRNGPDEAFRFKKTLQSRSSAGAMLNAVQAVAAPGGSWRLYWMEYHRGAMKGFTARPAGRESERDGPSPSFAEQQFQRPVAFDLRGTPPVLSQDGLRQYLFDGKSLLRCRRSDIDAPFSQPQLIANLSLPNYAPTPRRRSYFLTDDEQWLFYESAGDLFMVRVFDAPGWGFVVRGERIAPEKRPVAAASQQKPPVKPAGKSPPPADPRTRPLPYPLFRAKLLALLKARKYEAARRVVSAALKDPQLADDRDLVAWDRADVERTAAFWNDLDRALGLMKPGDEFSIGSVRVRFVRAGKGELVARTATTTVRKKVLEMRPGDVIDLVEDKLGRDDPQIQLHAACLRFYDERGNAKAALTLFARAGEEGKEFVERLARREIQQARHEMDRGNVGRALSVVDRVLKRHPQTRAAAKAKEMVRRAYAATRWDRVGPRKWVEKDGVYSAGEGAKYGSLLRSPQQFENFELRLEWKSDLPNGQGGVYFRYAGRGDLTQTAFKIQLSDDHGLRPDKLCTGSLFKVEAPSENAVRKRGEWNTLVLRVQGERVSVVINGRSVLQTVATSETIPRKGYVALDGALGGISYRKTLLFELPEAN